MSEPKSSLARRCRFFLQHWWTILREIAEAVVRVLANKTTRSEVLGAEILVGSAILVLIVAAAACWVVGVRQITYDYDEVIRAHWVWLVSQGWRPYHDFFSNHPPYEFLLTPVARAVSDAAAQLSVYRVLSGCAIPFLVLGLAAHAVPPGQFRPRSHMLWGIAIVCSHPYVLRFLVEFRMDNWANVIIAWSIYWWRRQPVTAFANLGLGLCTTVSALWFSPKLLFLPPLLVITALLTGAPWSPRVSLKAIAAYTTGVLSACLCFVVFLWFSKLDPRPVMNMVFQYNWDANRFTTSDTSLLDAIRDVSLFAWIVVAATALAGIMLWNRRLIDPFYIALIAFLALQAAMVRYPYKQFAAPWFMLGSVLLSNAAHRLYESGRRFALVLLVGLIGWTCWIQWTGIKQTWGAWSNERAAESNRRLLREMNRIALPSDRVVGAPPWHPITRPDVFFVSCNSHDALGYDTEFLLERQGLDDLVSNRRYREELNDHPPALIVLDGLYPKRQKEVLQRYIEEKRYAIISLEGHRVAVRPDRVQRQSLHREGPLEK